MKSHKPFKSFFATVCVLTLFAVQPGFAATKSVIKIKSAGRTANSIPNTILNGITAPLKTVGINGDFYIDTKNLNIYGPKKNNVWPAAISLRGTAGLAGTDGKSGTPGVAGSDGKTVTNTSTVSGTAGATGATGSTGATGLAGAAGANGAAGETGAAGASGSAGPAGPTGPAGGTGATGAPGIDGAPGAAGVTSVVVTDLAPWSISTGAAGTGTFFAVFPILAPNKKYIFTIIVSTSRSGNPGQIKGTIELNSKLAGLKSSVVTTAGMSNFGQTNYTSQIMFQGSISVGASVDSAILTFLDVNGKSAVDPISFTGIAWLTEVGSIT